MKKTILCLHAASANIALVEQAALDNTVQLQHIVDTQLMKMIKNYSPLDKQIEYAKNTIETLLSQKPDILFITCTNYIALLEGVELHTTIPVLKVDELLFEQLSDCTLPIKLLFTNKETIEGTMARLKHYLVNPLAIEVRLIPELFEWYINGDKQRHDQALTDYLYELHTINNEKMNIAVAQLSMSDSVEQYNKQYHAHVLNPLSALRSYLKNISR